MFCFRGDDAELYRNRTDTSSINTQVVADADWKIMVIRSRWPGSVHDITMFNNSRVKHLLDSLHLGKCCLLGDHGCALKKYLLVSLAEPQSPAEKLYN